MRLLDKLRVNAFKRKNASLITLTQTYFGQDRDIFGETIEEVVKSYRENGVMLPTY
ncbi:contact-dependent growth inhibition system immunity protein [Mixta calida]|uniref:contact-dependent growth inhibition system immunity protein n=1 Tax=Mixta calida TaxID=665913 RepID=UPI00290CD577|nr:contact-dependent growth inhibition system immunity protein [Mixta calida]MDU4289589.1 contact-dependent growth inhibition system immunity protein [Mixta calida]